MEKRKKRAFRWHLPHGKLGDCVCAFYLLENVGRMQNCTHLITCHRLAHKVAKLFHFHHISLTNEGGREAINMHWLSYVYETPYFVTGILKATQDCFGLKPELCKSLTPTITAKDTEDVTLVQLDGRTHKGIGAPMALSEKKQAIKTLAKYPAEVIGGPDTKPYLGDKFKYRVGSLRAITGELLKCRQFLGCDSGLSHLAGALGVPSAVVISKVNDELLDLYRSYRNTRTYQLLPRMVKLL